MSEQRHRRVAVEILAAEVVLERNAARCERRRQAGERCITLPLSEVETVIRRGEDMARIAREYHERLIREVTPETKSA